MDLTEVRIAAMLPLSSRNGWPRVASGGLVGIALRAFEGMLASGNPGLSPASRQKLIDLFNSRSQ